MSHTSKPFSIADIIQSNDALTQIGQHFQKIAGRELSPAAFRVAMFLEAYCMRDEVEWIMDRKQFQASVRDNYKLAEVMSPARAHEQLIEKQGEVARKSMGS
jgi:hypothetical protein